jgi:3-oxoacyl-[acyl-carrier protein] reductase
MSTDQAGAAVSRVAIVTGGSGGIGSAVARRLGQDGMAVIVHYAGSADRATEVVSGITATGGVAVAVAGDVADPADMTAVFDLAQDRFGGVDVVVNTAGIMLLAPVAEMDLDDFDRMQRANVRGTFVVSQLAARRLRSGGALINFSTTVTRLAPPRYAAYAATKGAVDAMTLILAREMRGKNVTVNAVAPGPTATPLYFEGKTDEQIAQGAAAAPLERLGTPDDVAETVAFLAGPARWINGQVVYANGGIA